MYGYFKDHADIVACAAALQEYIDEMFPWSDSGRSGRDSDVPEVSVSFSEFGAIIEVSELAVWQAGEGELTPESVIASFRARCDYWAMFGTGVASQLPPQPIEPVSQQSKPSAPVGVSLRSDAVQRTNMSLQIAILARELAESAGKVAATMSDELTSSINRLCEADGVAGDAMPATAAVEPQAKPTGTERVCADCGYTYDERRTPWPIRPSCVSCDVGA